MTKEELEFEKFVQEFKDSEMFLLSLVSGGHEYYYYHKSAEVGIAAGLTKERIKKSGTNTYEHLFSLTPEWEYTFFKTEQDGLDYKMLKEL